MNSKSDRYVETLHAFNLIQHVKESTYIKGNVIDHIITREIDSITLNGTTIGDLISDHYIVRTTLAFPKPEMKRKTVTFRKLKDIDVERFKQDITSTNVHKNHGSMNLDTLIASYDSDMRTLLDQHAPIISTSKRQDKRDAWFDNEARTKRTIARVYERKFGKTRNPEDKVIYQARFNDYKRTLHRSKQTILCNKVSQNERNQKGLFREMNKIMHRNQLNPLPEHSSATQLTNNFSNFFKAKIEKIQELFDADVNSAFEFDLDISDQSILFTCFKPLSEAEVKKIIAESNTTSCELDPIPTFLLKQCLDELLPVITRIVNLSITEGQMPNSFKTAVSSM